MLASHLVSRELPTVACPTGVAAAMVGALGVGLPGLSSYPATMAAKDKTLSDAIAKALSNVGGADSFARRSPGASADQATSKKARSLRSRKDIAGQKAFELDYDNLQADFEKALKKRLKAKRIGDDEIVDVTSIVMRDFDDTPIAAVARTQFNAAVNLVAIGIVAAREANRSAAETASPMHLRKWEDEKVNYPSAETFLKEVYGARLGIDGDLTMADLRRVDQPLASALYLESRRPGRPSNLHALLPTVKMRRDMQLLRKYGYVPEGEDRRRKLTALALEAGPRP